MVDLGVFGVGWLVLGWVGPHGLLRLTHPTGLFVIVGIMGWGLRGLRLMTNILRCV
jgi:hypothetical protein